MSKSKKWWLTAATSLIVMGLTIFVIVMSLNNWDFKKLSTVEYQSCIYNISEEFIDVYVKTNTADVNFEISENGECEVAVYEQENMRHNVEVKDGVLTINVVDNRKWYEHIGIAMGSPKITIYLPEKDYVSVMQVKTSTGDISIKDMSVELIECIASTGEINISNVTCDESIKTQVSTGDIKITDTTCNKFNSDGSTGDISMKNLVVAEIISIERDTGDVKFNGCDAGEIYVETDTGDITGTLLTDKVFYAETDMGKVDLPKISTGGRCDLETDTGDIKISILN